MDGAEVNGVLADQANGTNGAAVHTFDPDASAQEKAASAGKARTQMKTVKDAVKADAPGARELTIDTSKSNIIPTINVEAADGDSGQHSAAETVVERKDDREVDVDEPVSPGAMPTAKTVVPDWYKVGWKQALDIKEKSSTDEDSKGSTDEVQQDRALLETFISEQYYGQWYHDAGIIIFAVFTSHYLTLFGFGWGWLIILLAVCATYYSTSIRRVRRNARDDIQRELVKTRLGSEHETADWINSFLDRFWLIYEPVLSLSIVSSVDQVLSSNTPAFLDSLRLTQFTLGTKAPRIDKVRTFPRTEEDIVMMDWGISFTPNDLSDLTHAQAARKQNPKIVLSVRVGKGLATAAMPILLEDITFSGLMRIRMKLMTNFPHVQLVDLCFLEKPVIDYVLKPLGGETFGFDIANLPGLSSFIRDTTHAVLGPMMYDPNVFTLNLEQLLSGAPLDAAIGVLQVTVESARGIKGTKIGGGTPDPYVSISINDRAELAKTKYKHNTYNPTWSETKFLLINNLTENLTFNLYDYNDRLKNTHMGSSTFELAKLNDDATQEGIVTQVLKDGKERGELRYDVSFYPVLTPEEGSEEVSDTNVGIVRLVIHQAKNLDRSKSMTGDFNPLAKLFIGDSNKEIHTTPKFKHTDQPVWESPHEFLCANKSNSVILIKVIDDRDFLKDPLLGFMSIKLIDLLEAKKQGKDWFPMSKCKTGKLRVSAEWKPLNMAGSLHGADSYTPPIGVVRLLLDRATDVKNVEAALGGKSDPYVRVQINNVTKGRTEVVNNNLNPVWDQIIYIPVHSLKEVVMLECMDYQHLTKDRSLGSVEFRVSDLAKESSDKDYPYESTGVKEATDPIRLDGGNNYKGKLHYTASFVPALALKGVKFDTGGNEMERAAEANVAEGSDDEGGVVESSGSSMSSSDEELQAVPKGEITIKSERTHKKNAKSTDTTRTVETVDTTNTNATVPPSPITPAPDPESEKVSLTTEELLTHQSGIIVFSVRSGTLAKKARLEVLLDDGYWPCFSTTKARSINANWQFAGEGFIKELDFGRVWLRLNEADEGDKDAIIAEWKGDAKAFLQTTLEGPQTFTLRSEDERSVSTVSLEARYIPVPVKLEPRESINNQGLLRVDLFDGRDIPGVDRGGKSDPFAVFSLNDQKVFKSQTKKKTLTPEWNENFSVTVPSRVGSDFFVEVFDWDQIGRAETLGSAKLELADLEPFESVERILKLSSSKHGQKGEVRVRLLFQPEIIAKSRKNTSTFSTAGRAMTQVGGLPVQAGKGVIHGVTGVFKRNHKDEDVPEVPRLPSGQASHPVGDSESSHVQAPFPSSESETHIEPGLLKITVLDAKDLSMSDAKPYATLRLGDKEHKTKYVGKTSSPEWNETFTFTASGLTPKLYCWVHHHQTIGKDKELASGEVDIWRHVQPKKVNSAEVLLEFSNGEGLIRLQLEYSKLEEGTLLEGRSSVSSLKGHGDTLSRTFSMTQRGSPSRFSLSKKRTEGSDD